jgi:hypothetical protein
MADESTLSRLPLARRLFVSHQLWRLSRASFASLNRSSPSEHFARRPGFARGMNLDGQLLTAVIVAGWETERRQDEIELQP